MPDKVPNYRHPSRESRGDWGAGRLSSGARGYGRQWREGVRAQVLREEPFCRSCLAMGEQELTVIVDHIVPRRAGGSDARGNLQGLCRACSNRKLPNDLRLIRDFLAGGGRKV